MREIATGRRTPMRSCFCSSSLCAARAVCQRRYRERTISFCDALCVVTESPVPTKRGSMAGCCTTFIGKTRYAWPLSGAGRQFSRVSSRRFTRNRFLTTMPETAFWRFTSCRNVVRKAAAWGPPSAEWRAVVFAKSRLRRKPNSLTAVPTAFVL